MLNAFIAGAQAAAPFAGRAAVTTGTAIAAAVVAKKATTIAEKKVLETVGELTIAKEAATEAYRENRVTNVEEETTVKKTA